MLDSIQKPKRPTVGLVLSSGGSRGSAHIGVVKVLEEHQIPIDIVVGASIGAVVGAAYAAGVSIEAIEAEWLKTNLWRVAKSLRPAFSLRNWSSGAEAMKLFRSLVGEKTFEDLTKKYAAVATDIETGEPVVIQKGSLVQAMRASSSIPIVFAPVEREGKYLADGGMANPLPINVARELGAEIVIAVDVNAKPRRLRKKSSSEPWDKPDPERRPPNLVEVMSATIIILQRKLVEYSLATQPADVMIQPSFYADFFGYHHGGEGIKAGEKAAREAIPEIRNLLL
ncbi:patatin-like phospholipase family protein [Candidatus Acetothermia bacterium]|nr:patatin-like phospholipase family protein [Candidatus Acetothermia bacterium]MBI3644266.1 patatin-like phospholipase family protein [Candidatus Acetothermia bacterium]